MARDAEDYRAWLTLNLLPDLGRGGINKLIRRFGSPEAVLDASEAELSEVDGVGRMAVRSILNRRKLADVDTELKLIDKHVCHWVDGELEVDVSPAGHHPGKRSHARLAALVAQLYKDL